MWVRLIWGKCRNHAWKLITTIGYFSKSERYTEKKSGAKTHPGAVLANGATLEGGADFFLNNHVLCENSSTFESGAKIVPWVELSYVYHERAPGVDPFWLHFFLSVVHLISSGKRDIQATSEWSDGQTDETVSCDTPPLWIRLTTSWYEGCVKIETHN